MAISKKPLAAALGAAFLATAIPTLVSAASNPFSAQQLGGGYDLANYDKHAEGKCGEGKCGDSKAGGEGSCGDKTADAEGKCGGDAKPAAAPAEKKASEGKCGEGKCGGAM